MRLLKAKMFIRIFINIRFPVTFSGIVPFYMVAVHLSIGSCYDGFHHILSHVQRSIKHVMYLSVSLMHGGQFLTIQIDFGNSYVGIYSHMCIFSFAVYITTFSQIDHRISTPVSFVKIISIFLYFRSKVTKPFILRAGIHPPTLVGTAKSNIFQNRKR